MAKQEPIPVRNLISSVSQMRELFGAGSLIEASYREGVRMGYWPALPYYQQPETRTGALAPGASPSGSRKP